MSISLDDLTIPSWVRWIAQDGDGHWWGYEIQPQEFSRGWYENELGRRIRLKKCPPNAAWHKTLTQLPK